MKEDRKKERKKERKKKVHKYRNKDLRNIGSKLLWLRLH